MLLLLANQWCLGQSVRDQLHKAVPSCESISKNVDRIIGNVTHVDSLQVLIDIWRESCGQSEAIMRYDILEAIEFEALDSNMVKEYINNYQYYYRYRMQHDSMSSSNYYQSFYFEHLVPGGNYDQYTRGWATALIPYTRKQSDEYLLCLLFSNRIDEFAELTEGGTLRNSTLVRTMAKSPYYERKSDGNFKIGAGLWLPMAKLSKHFNPSPRFTFSAGLPIGLDYRLELKIGFTPFIGNDSLLVTFDDVEYKTDKFSGFNFGLVGIKEHRLNDKYHFDYLLELGAFGLNSNIPDPGGEENSTHGIITLDVAAGFNLKRFLDSDKTIGLHCSYHLCPLNLNKQLDTPVGNSYLLSSIYFSF